MPTRPSPVLQPVTFELTRKWRFLCWKKNVVKKKTKISTLKEKSGQRRKLKIKSGAVIVFAKQEDFWRVRKILASQRSSKCWFDRERLVPHQPSLSTWPQHHVQDQQLFLCGLRHDWLQLEQRPQEYARRSKLFEVWPRKPWRLHQDYQLYYYYGPLNTNCQISAETEEKVCTDVTLQSLPHFVDIRTWSFPKEPLSNPYCMMTHNSDKRFSNFNCYFSTTISATSCRDLHWKRSPASPTTPTTTGPTRSDKTAAGSSSVPRVSKPATLLSASYDRRNTSEIPMTFLIF